MGKILATTAFLLLAGCVSDHQVKTSRDVIVVNSVTFGLNWLTIYAKHKSEDEGALLCQDAALCDEAATCRE